MPAHADEFGLLWLDLNLLPVFAVLMRERSVTRAGRALFLSQPATPAALARLREPLKDELPVRNGRALEPTARATRLLADLQPCLDVLARTLGEATPFDPAADHRTFRVGCTDDVAVALLPALTDRLREQAPRCDLVLRQANYPTIPRMLGSGEIGAAVAYVGDDPPASAKRRVVRRGAFAVVRDAGTPGPVDLDAYRARPHVPVTPQGDLHGFADTLLEALARSRRVVLGLPDFGLVRRAVLGTDFLCTVPDVMAEALADFGGIAADPLPLPGAPRVEVRMAWPATLDHDPGEEWLRARIPEEASQKAEGADAHSAPAESPGSPPLPEGRHRRGRQRTHLGRRGRQDRRSACAVSRDAARPVGDTERIRFPTISVTYGRVQDARSRDGACGQFMTDMGA